MLSKTTLQDLARWTGAQVLGTNVLNQTVHSVSSDSRTLKQGEVFVALRGDSFDGHQFMAQAISMGALAIISEHVPAELKQASIPLLQVKDSLQAYVAIGKALRDSFSGKVLGITGSAGKSSTKDMVGVLLGPNTLVSPKSYNNLLGTSKTLCLLEDTTKNLVLEMGMNGLREIQAMCENFRPEAGVITNIGTAHIGKLGGQSGIYQAKKELMDWLGNSSHCWGVGINLDDPLVVQAVAEAVPKNTPRVTYSAKDSKADIFIEKTQINAQTGALTVDFKVEGRLISARLPHFGIHHAHNLAAAMALARLAGISWDLMEERIVQVVPSESRGQLIDLGKSITLIDESYNSNPSALISSLESVMKMDPHRRKVLVLGEMRELDEFSETLHREVGQALGKLLMKTGQKAEVVCVGADSRFLREGLQEEMPQLATHGVPDVDAVKPWVSALLAPGDIVLVKGSRGNALDQLVKHLKWDKESAFSVGSSGGKTK